ncbi:BRO family, N-terminal domain [Salmonella enterica subsp. arizonae]|uniref:BRO family, N-terminal domain n=1 Tax=Salmonella enterica subsp. arizonae TaxID=59203 RepID=A0A3S4GQA5_SALER|nr:BRO family, N-terminal domain [Salmonella enterica subsp. arizonae]
MTIEKSRFNSETAPQSYVSQKKIPQAVEGDISVIRFEGIKVRIFNMDGDPWFIAKDVCEALEIADHKVALRRLDADEKGGVFNTHPRWIAGYAYCLRIGLLQINRPKPQGHNRRNVRPSLHKLGISRGYPVYS